MKLSPLPMLINNEPIITEFDLRDTVGYCIVTKALGTETYQTPFGYPYDFYTNTTKDEIKVRNKAYKTLDVEYSKLGELLLEEYEDKKRGANYKYLIHYVVVPENKMYTIELHSIIDNHTYEVVEWPESTCGNKDKKKKLIYKIPINEWKSTPCDCTNYNNWIIKGKLKYKIK